MDDKGLNTVLDNFDANWFASTQANDGGSFTRHPIGDYRVRIRDIEIKAKEGGENPHNMLVVTAETIAVIDGEPSAISMTTVTRYGTPQSPKFMQQRAKQLLTALDQRGPFAPKSLIGREYDVTVTWEKGAPVVDPVTGAERVYVNDRVGFERKAGSPKPPKANARAASQAAIRYLKEAEAYVEAGEVGGEGQAATGSAPWEDQARSQPAATTSASSDAWMPESDVPAAAHQYRVVIALGKPSAEEAKRSLLAKRIDPNGPVNLDLIAEPLRGEYQAWKAKSAPSDGGLPPLDDGPTANGAGSGGSKARTGTRRSAATP